MKVHDYSMSVGKRGFGRVTVRKEGWAYGEVATPYGFVSVYAQGDEKHYHTTRLDFIHNGTLHIRSFKGKRYSPRGIATKAKQFAREIATKEPQQSECEHEWHHREVNTINGIMRNLCCKHCGEINKTQLDYYTKEPS